MDKISDNRSMIESEVVLPLVFFNSGHVISTPTIVLNEEEPLPAPSIEMILFIDDNCACE